MLSLIIRRGCTLFFKEPVNVGRGSDVKKCFSWSKRFHSEGFSAQISRSSYFLEPRCSYKIVFIKKGVSVFDVC